MNKNVILFIDTSSREKLLLTLEIDGKTYIKEHASTTYNNQALLPLILTILKDHTLVLKDLTQLHVHTGPGSFTGLRVGVAVANALSYTLKIPVNGKMFTKGQALVEPVYSV